MQRGSIALPRTIRGGTARKDTQDWASEAVFLRVGYRPFQGEGATLPLLGLALQAMRK